MHELLRQLHSISELQRHLLPRRVPQPPGWVIEVHYDVGRWPGGDYYDFLPLPDGRILLLVGDASDEGGPSSVMVALVRASLHACPLSSGQEQLPFCPMQGGLVQPPHLILGHLNRVLVENTLEEQYMTVFCGLLSPAEGTLHYANAGHPAPRWRRAATGSVEGIRDAAGQPLGVGHNSAYHQKRIEIEPGDVVVFYSDGVTAAQNADGQLFGCERLDEAIGEAAAQGASAVKDNILARFDTFLAGKAPQDDVTILVVERQR
jgi:sigma-B regulation protein RsbU (phosphoserine phosphatase)